MRRRGAIHPFTMLELLIAVSITMLVALGLYGFSSGVSSAWAQLMAERNRVQELLALDRVIDRSLSNLVPFVWKNPDDDNEEFPFIVATPESLRFAYLHTIRDPGEGALRFAEFILEDGTLYLKYANRPFYDWDQVADHAQTVILAENVAEISFQYADWNDDTDAEWADRLLWLDEWETEDSERKDAPLAVLLTITWNDGRTQSWMRRTMGNSLRERFGAWNPLSEDKRNSSGAGL